MKKTLIGIAVSIVVIVVGIYALCMRPAGRGDERVTQGIETSGTVLRDGAAMVYGEKASAGDTQQIKERRHKKETGPGAEQSGVSLETVGKNSWYGEPGHGRKDEEPDQAEEPGDEETLEEEEKEYELNKTFEIEAKDSFPLLSVQTHNPLDKRSFGPAKGEIWIRVKPDNARELEDIMDEMASLYYAVTDYKGPVTVMHWVGGRPHAKYIYERDDEQGTYEKSGGTVQ